MALVGIKCDDLAHYGEEFSFDTCIACSLAGAPRRCHAPTSLLVAMAKAQDDRRDAGISATMLLDCPRKVALATETDWCEHPADFWSRFRGTLWHHAMEHYGVVADHIDDEVRRRKTYDVDGVPMAITGKPDHVNKQRGLVLDFKSCTSVTAKPISLGKPKESHEEQINIYIDLCDGGARLDTGEIEHVAIAQAGIVYLDMKSYRKVPVRVWSADERHAFIVDRLRPIARYRREAILPDLLFDDKGRRSWRCASKWCALREACDAATDAGR